MLHSTKAGSKDTVLNELQVMPQSWLSKRVVTMVTPVAKWLIVLRSSRVMLLSINRV